MSEQRSVLSETVTKLLSDKLYDRRKQAATEIEAQVKDALFRSAGGRIGQHFSQVQRIIDCIRSQFIESQQPNHRKGGLIGLASVAIGLADEVAQFLPQLVVPVLDLFNDEDARVRYYSCEALYNITKVANEAALAHFNEIFDGLCLLYSDPDADVKNGVGVLDRLMKDIVTQNASKFRAVKFIPKLAERMQAQNPYIRQLVLAWVTLLLKVPEVDMVRHIPQYLEGLFNMLSDQTRDTKHNADTCLGHLLTSLKNSEPKKALSVVLEAVGIVVKCCFVNDNCSRLSALCWLHQFIDMQLTSPQERSVKSTDTWVSMLPQLLVGTLHCIDDTEDEIQRMAVEMNNGLLDMANNLNNDIPVNLLVDQLLKSMESKESTVVRTACLQWLCMLLVQCPSQMLQWDMLHRLFAPIFDTLLHPNDEVVVAALRVLAQIMEGRNAEEDDQLHEGGQDLFTVVTNKLLQLFARNRKMLESRGRLMMRHLCAHLDPRRLYITVAQGIQHETDLELAQQIVQTFSWILLTANETKILREELITTAPLSEQTAGWSHNSSWQEPAGRSVSGFGRSLFMELLEPWFHNPVSALALCLWAQQYEIATELTARIAAFEPTLDLLKQLDQLVHLLESPIFSRLRLRLLEPRKHSALIKCLLGLAMLLPQAGAFHILRERIHVVQSGLLLDAQRDATAREVNVPDSGRSDTRVSTDVFLRTQLRKSISDNFGSPDLPTLLGRFDAVTASQR